MGTEIKELSERNLFKKLSQETPTGTKSQELSLRLLVKATWSNELIQRNLVKEI